MSDFGGGDYLTQNQINYAKLQEERRHNIATEGFTGIELQETKRHNISSEGINWYAANEQGRHNLASENINWYSAIKQGEIADSQAWRNYAEGNYSSAKTEQLGKDYDLERDKFQHQVWKDIKTIGISEGQLEKDQEALKVTKKKVEQEIDNLMLYYELDVAKYGTEKKKVGAQVFRDIASGAKSVTDAFLELFDWIWGLKQGLLPGK